MAEASDLSKVVVLKCKARSFSSQHGKLLNPKNDTSYQRNADVVCNTLGRKVMLDLLLYSFIPRSFTCSELNDCTSTGRYKNLFIKE